MTTKLPQAPRAEKMEHGQSSNAQAGLFADAMVLTPESRWPTRLPQSTVDEVLARPVPSFGGSGMDRDQAAKSASIVVVTFDNLVFNRLCLESVLGSIAHGGCELIVVDNGSTDGTIEYLEELARRNSTVRLILNGQNRGFASACNQGLSAAGGEVLVLLNNDTIVHGDWLDRLSSRLEDPAVGLVGPVTNRCGNEAQVRVGYDTYGEFVEFSRAWVQSREGQDEELPMLTMFCVALRRDVHERVGELDERYELGLFEDEDYCVRVKRAGYRIICAQDTFVHHFGQASIGKLAASEEYGALFHNNRKRFEEKWGLRWTPHKRRPDAGYRELVAAIRKTLEATLPPGATVLVASRGDENLVTLPGRRTLHFPTGTDGLYAGYHPRDSSAAIADLERLREQGCQYFVLPETMFWWLQHYEEFAQHLARRYRCIEFDETCLVYQLAALPDSPAAAGVGHCSATVGMEKLSHRLVTILCPIRGDLPRTRRALQPLFCSAPRPHRVLLIDNTGRDERLGAYLAALAEEWDHIALAVLDHQADDAVAINAGLAMAPGDVLVSHEGCDISSDMLAKMCAAAHSRDRVATVCGGAGGHYRLVTRAALRMVGTLDASTHTALGDAWDDFDSRAAAQGFLQLVVKNESPGLSAAQGEHSILFLAHAGTGGARIATEELVRAASSSHRCVLMLADVSEWSLYRPVGDRLEITRQYRFSEPWRVDSALDEERGAVLRDTCHAFGVGLANIHHLLCSGTGVISALGELGIPTVVSFHDFYALCPTGHLIDDQEKFCGGLCTPGAGNCPTDSRFMPEPGPRLKHDYVHRHRADMDAVLSRCSAFTAPSDSARTLVLKHLPSVKAEYFHVIEHGYDAARRSLAHRPPEDGGVRILCPGNLNPSKGTRLIWQLLELNTKRGRRFEFHFLGNHSADFRPESLGGICHGPYHRESFAEAVAGIAPSFSLLASTCSETFSYTLSESWAAGVPVFASDRGAFRDRIGQHGGGWLFDPDDAEGFYSGMAAVLETPGAWQEEVDRIAGIPLPSMMDEARQFLEIFGRCIGQQAASIRSARSSG
jgi:GT2 family glycosyltransferase/glycosyltransferase involved in cell wall biosynthesis